MATICNISANLPVAVNILFEQILEEMAHYDVQRLVHIMSRFAQASCPDAALSTSSVRLLSLHVMSASMRFMTSSQLIQELPKVVSAAVTSLNNSLVDLRKASIFVLVEVYLVVGDALYPFLADLTPPQRKLLTIYVERRMKERRDMNS